MKNYNIFREFLRGEPACYWIVNKEIGKTYSGSTSGMYERLLKHIRVLNKGKHHNKELQTDWDLYGENVFEIIVEATAEVEGAKQLEKESIRSDDNCYNKKEAYLTDDERREYKREYDAANYAVNRERINARKREYREANRDEINRRARERYHAKKLNKTER